MDVSKRAAEKRPPGQTKRDMIEKRRMERDAAAPGPWNQHARWKWLLPRWKELGRLCAYCDAPVEAVDHVIPLSLGGTNYEGNLVPACHACNSAKAGKLLAQWRYRAGEAKRIPQFATGRQVARPKRVPILYGHTCPCGREFTSPAHHARYCSSECRAEAGRAYMRNRYRASVGIPLDVPKYSIRAPRVA